MADKRRVDGVIYPYTGDSNIDIDLMLSTCAYFKTPHRDKWGVYWLLYYVPVPQCKVEFSMYVVRNCRRIVNSYWYCISVEIKCVPAFLVSDRTSRAVSYTYVYCPRGLPAEELSTVGLRVVLNLKSSFTTSIANYVKSHVNYFTWLELVSESVITWNIV